MNGEETHLVELEEGGYVVTAFTIYEEDWCPVCEAAAKDAGCHWWGPVTPGHGSVGEAWSCWESRERGRDCRLCGEETSAACFTLCRLCWWSEAERLGVAHRDRLGRLRLGR